MPELSNVGNGHPGESRFISRWVYNLVPREVLGLEREGGQGLEGGTQARRRQGLVVGGGPNRWPLKGRYPM